MKKRGAKKIEIEDLAIMIQKGFSEQDKRFDNLDDRVDSLETKFDKLDKAVFNLNLTVDSIDERLKGIEKVMGPLVMVVNAMKINWRDHETRISKIERSLQTK